MEATGGYESALLAALLEQGMAVHRADPRASRFFLRSLGRRAKTDRLDAQGLARYGAERHTELKAPPFAERRTANAADLDGSPGGPEGHANGGDEPPADPRYHSLQASVQSVLATLEEQIAMLDRRIDSLVRTAAALAAKMEVMIAIPSVGKQTANTLLAFMPELGTLTRKTKPPASPDALPIPATAAKPMATVEPPAAGHMSDVPSTWPP